MDRVGVDQRHLEEFKVMNQIDLDGRHGVARNGGFPYSKRKKQIAVSIIAPFRLKRRTWVFLLVTVR